MATGTFLPVLNEVEKASIHERQPLPERYLGLSDEEMATRIAAARARLGDRLVILVAWLASCGVVFVIGYYVGKDAVPPSAGIAPGVIQVPVAGVPDPPDEPGAGGTFYESLGRQTGAAVTAPPPRVATTVAVREASARPTTTMAAPARATTTTASTSRESGATR